ncbi:AAA family ATPase, partial [Candidatus Marithioploca araucensis]|nr:AAA family ATPase [Candidatus Marithioploca araucensis]
VDRTSHIRLIEEAGHQLLFLRPRRFGKSLLLSMLENYYDVAKADEFDKLFGELAIGKNPTPLHNQYLVMKWDFSVINAQGTLEDIKDSIHNHINNSIEAFVDCYQHLWQYQIKINPQDAVSSFESALIAIKQTPYHLYLLIDEYDNFANELMMGRSEINPERYKALTSTEGSLKTLFKTVKSASGGRGLERVFLTGASPILMSDMTTAYNIAENIYLKPYFNDLCGFKEPEIQAVLNQVVAECKLSPEEGKEALKLMQAFYNAYCFSDMDNELIYNPTLTLYFLKHLQQHCQFPRQMLDDNLTMDLNKLFYLSRLPNGRAIIKQALNGTPPLTLSLLANRFGLEQMLKNTQSNQFIISLLYYLGILTLDGETELRQLRFKIPNLVVQKLYVEHLFEMLLPQDTKREEVRLLAEEFYQSGELQPICDFMTKRYFKVFDNRDYKEVNELTIKTAFLTVLFNDAWYMMDSETPA